jgi:hypothetical protein
MGFFFLRKTIKFDELRRRGKKTISEDTPRPDD